MGQMILNQRWTSVKNFFSFLGMSKPYRMPEADEQIVLEGVQIESVKVENYPRFQSLLRRHHYLKGIKPVGERIYRLG